MSDATQEYMRLASERRDAYTQALIDEARESPVVSDSTTLTGEHHAAYVEFCAASRAVEEHQRDGQARMERYKAALNKLSTLAAKAGG